MSVKFYWLAIGPKIDFLMEMHLIYQKLVKILLYHKLLHYYLIHLLRCLVVCFWLLCVLIIEHVLLLIMRQVMYRKYYVIYKYTNKYYVDANHSPEWSLAQFIPSPNIVHFCLVIFGNAPLFIYFKKDVAASISITLVFDALGMSAFFREIKNYMLHYSLL